ncbi:MAG: hypothetical protein NC131_06875 [Roseburia sp.]|nr:hypothetical protein [Roseburia sp.]
MIRRQRVLFKPLQLNGLCERYDASGARIEYVLNYTNNIVKFTRNGKASYFKEAKIRGGLKSCIKDCVHCFFTEICADAELERRVSESLSNKKNFKKLVKMGYKDGKGSPFNRYLVSGDERFLGLPLAESGKKASLRKFIFYIYGEISNYHYNTGVKRGQRQTFLSTRALAVKRLADMLGLGYMVPETRYVKTQFCGRERYGVLEAEAEGVNVASVPCGDRLKRVTPALVRELTNLNVLNVLCSERDQRPDNYRTLTNGDGGYIGVVSFDNDGPDVFLPSFSIAFKNCVNCSPIVDKRGYINRPHMDKNLANAVCGMEAGEIKTLSPYLTYLQRLALWKRFKKIKKAILKTEKARSGFLLEKDEWTAEHVDGELSGKYGKTYAVSFVTDCYYPDGLSPFDKC